jgi:hypothetical protein
LARLRRSDAILVAPGFGERGVEGKIRAIETARNLGIPFLGVCYGFQLAAVEFARNVLELAQANTSEVDPHTPDPVVCLLEEQKAVADLGGTMRLGAQRVELEPGSRIVLKLDATIGLARRQSEPSRMTSHDRRFLESLHIRVDDEILDEDDALNKLEITPQDIKFLKSLKISLDEEL